MTKKYVFELTKGTVDLTVTLLFNITKLGLFPTGKDCTSCPDGAFNLSSMFPDPGNIASLKVNVIGLSRAEVTPPEGGSDSVILGKSCVPVRGVPKVDRYRSGDVEALYEVPLICSAVT